MKKLNVIVFFLLAVAASAFAAEAKSPAILLQQGIYAEETEGNLDKAMEIYSQIRSDYNDVERISAIATYQLGMCYLKKDNKQKAIELFQEVVNYFPEQKVAAKKAQQQLDKLGIKNDTDKNIFDILRQVSTYIGSKYGEVCAEAGVKKLYSNSHIYVVDKDFIVRGGGMGYIYNWTDKPITEKHRIGGTSYPNQKLYDILGNLINFEITADNQIYWTPKEPLLPGGFFNYGWAIDGSRPLTKTEQGYQLKMNNHFGDHCYETFFLAVPEGMQIVNQDEEYTGKGNANGWDIYWWKKEVPQGTDHTVNVVLSDKAVNSLRPVVIKTSPENFANNVSPDVNQITITFDKEMFTYGYSWCQNNPQTFPETTGKPFFSDDKFSCTLPVKLKAGQYYRIGINTPPYFGFRGDNGEKASECVIVFATADANGNPTAIPEELLADAKKINSNPSEPRLTQEVYNDIDPNGLIYFKNPHKHTNFGTEPITSTSFINSDFVNVTGMYYENGQPVKFTTTHEGNHFRYNITFDKPILPGETVEGIVEGTMSGLIKPVKDTENVFRYFMVHSPSAGQPVRRIETYLLPKGAEVVSTSPNIQQAEKDGRIELHVEKVIPADGSITTSFQYKLAGANAITSKEDKLQAENLASEGWSLWKERKLAEAEEKFKQAVSLDPQCENAYQGLGWAQLNQSKKNNAKDSFGKCVAINPKNAAALNGLGWIAQGQNDANEAIKWWEKAVEVSSGNATASLEGLTTVYMEKGDYQNAVKYYEMWLKVEPNNADAKAGLEKAKIAIKPRE